METKNFSAIYTAMRNHMITNCSKVTDFNEGSIIRTIFESVANVIERAYVDTRVGYSNNLLESVTSIFGFSKKEGAYATVEVKFSRNKALTTSTTISSGTKISDGTHIFVTSSTATIEADETESNSVSAQADTIGNEYNISAGAINSIESAVPDEVVSVTNELKATGGADDESSTDHLARFKNYINGLQGSNLYGLKQGVLAVTGVRSVGIAEHFPPSDIYNVTVYVDDGSGNLTDDLKQTIEDKINGVDDDSTNPGLRAAGINVEVKAATQVPVKVSATVTIYRTEDSQALYDIENTLRTYLNSFSINKNVLISQVQTTLMNAHSYIHDIRNLKLNDATETIQIGVNQIAVYDSMDITLETE